MHNSFQQKFPTNSLNIMVYNSIEILYISYHFTEIFLGYSLQFDIFNIFFSNNYAEYRIQNVFKIFYATNLIHTHVNEFTMVENFTTFLYFLNPKHTTYMPLKFIIKLKICGSLFS